MSWSGFTAERLPLWQRHFSRNSPAIEALELGLEPLESRTMLAGAVNVSVDNGQLVIVGDNDDNSISILESSTVFNITGTNGTTVVGGTNITGIFAGMTIRMSGGADHVQMQNVRISGDVVVDGGTGPGSTQLTDNIILGSLTVKNGKSNVASSTSRDGHVTNIDYNLIQGDVSVTNGSSKIVIDNGSAVAMHTRVFGNTIDGSVSIVNATSNATAGTNATGVTNQVNANSITGNLTMKTASSRATGMQVVNGVSNHVTDNSIIGGDLVIASASSRASSTGSDGLSVHAHRTEVAFNYEIAGDVTITAKNSTTTGNDSAFSGASNVDVCSNTVIGGDVAVIVGNGKSTSTNGSAVANSTQVDFGTIAGNVTIQHGTAKAAGTNATGNTIGSNGIDAGGRITTSTRSSSSTGSLQAHGSQVYINSSGVEGITVSNGASRVSGDSVGAVANDLYISVFNSVLTAGVEITNGAAKATSSGDAIGNRVRIELSESATGELNIDNGRANAMGESSYGNQTHVNFRGLSLSGNIDIKNGTASANAFGSSLQKTIANDVIVASRTLGHVTIDNGKGIATGVNETVGIRTNYSGLVTGGGNLYIRNRAGKATTSRADQEAFGILTQIDDSSDFGADLRGNVEVIVGAAAHFKPMASSLGRDSWLKVLSASIDGTLKFSGGKGDNLVQLDDVSIERQVTVSTGSSNDRFRVKDCFFGADRGL